MRLFATVLIAACMPIAAIAQTAAPAAAPAAPGYSTSATTIGTLLADPAARQVLMANIPGVVTHEQIGMATAMTLRDIQMYVPDQLTSEMLAKLDVELAKVPVAK